MLLIYAAGEHKLLLWGQLVMGKKLLACGVLCLLAALVVVLLLLCGWLRGSALSMGVGSSASGAGILRWARWILIC
ncbi:hypothetical protein, partial [Pseudomonas syringae group genomosp. 7]|uniref:hypothetical protein n=1 Tax=Pseudomonas syringae group genomosp. 7 TaxID=251699 RepID=UPI0037700901